LKHDIFLLNFLQSFNLTSPQKVFVASVSLEITSKNDQNWDFRIYPQYSVFKREKVLEKKLELPQTLRARKWTISLGESIRKISRGKLSECSQRCQLWLKEKRDWGFKKVLITPGWHIFQAKHHLAMTETSF